MNLKRGLLRAFIVTSIIWTAVTFWITTSNLQEYNPADRWSFHMWEDSLPAIFAPWLILAAIISMRWIQRGFRS